MDTPQQDWKKIPLQFPPSFLPYRPSPEKFTTEPVRNDFSNPILANEQLVCNSFGNVNTRPNIDKTQKGSLENPQDQIHTMPLRLVAWKLSGKTCLQKKYQQGLQNLSAAPGGRELSLITKPPGRNLI